ncbi:MAG TPA: fibronectin type III domain-containing protein, partial [Thermoanaerobaculia bacterium]|nr:fibronectin type III domain-containing protein [Thermoanaerobaculia bacterium]
MLRRLLAALALLAAAPAFAAAVQGGSIPLPLPLFPPNNWWNIDVSNAPLDGNSANFITFIGPTKGLHPDFGGDAGGGDVYGMPFIVVDGAQPKKTVTFVEFGSQSDAVDYPIPDEAKTMNGWVEGGQPGNVDQRDDADRHMLIVDKTNNTLYELYHVWWNGSAWEAGSGAFFDMKTNNRRPDTWTSADAAGLAILPGLIRWDEVFGPDEIRHAIRFTVRATNGYVYPASHEAGSTSGALPMGARLRLKSSKNISTYAPEIQKIFRAFKKYGLIVADNGSDMYIGGTYDTRWNNDVLNPAFSSLKASDFEVVQRGWQPPFTLVVSLPQAAGAGDAADVAVSVYDQNYNLATGYTGTIHFTSTDGAATLPVDYTFTGADAGSHTFASGLILRTAGLQLVTATDTVTATVTGTQSVTVGPPAPTGVTAAATSPAQVQIVWNASAGATQYEVLRASSVSGPWTSLITTAGLAWNDNTVSGSTTYIYRIRALDASARPSPLSAPDTATTLVFTDDPVLAGGTIVKAVHLLELRQAVNS